MGAPPGSTQSGKTIFVDGSTTCPGINVTQFSQLLCLWVKHLVFRGLWPPWPLLTWTSTSVYIPVLCFLWARFSGMRLPGQRICGVALFWYVARLLRNKVATPVMGWRRPSPACSRCSMLPTRYSDMSEIILYCYLICISLTPREAEHLFRFIVHLGLFFFA